MEIWREFCWLHSSSPSAVSSTRPAPWCPRRQPITKNSPVLLSGWTSRILKPFKVSCTSSSSRESRPDSDVVLLRHSGPFAVWVGSLSRLTPVLFLAVREFWPIFICSAACIKRCAQSLSTSPSMILTRGGDSVTYHVTFYFRRTRNTRGGEGGEMSFGFWGLRFWGHQTVVFLRFKTDSSSDFSPLIQNKYDSRVFKMRY